MDQAQIITASNTRQTFWTLESVYTYIPASSKVVGLNESLIGVQITTILFVILHVALHRSNKAHRGMLKRLLLILQSGWRKDTSVSDAFLPLQFESAGHLVVEFTDNVWDLLQICSTEKNPICLCPQSAPEPEFLKILEPKHGIRSSTGWFRKHRGTGWCGRPHCDPEAAWCSMAQQRGAKGSAPAVCCPCRWPCPVTGQGANRDSDVGHTSRTETS